MVAEIPCHAVKSPFEAAHRLADPQRNLRPELRARTASCNPSGLAERDLAGGQPALPRGRASRERITFSTGSFLKDSEKRPAVCTRPTSGLPTGPAAPQHRPGGQSHRQRSASPKESCKIPEGQHGHRQGTDANLLDEVF